MHVSGAEISNQDTVYEMRFSFPTTAMCRLGGLLLPTPLYLLLSLKNEKQSDGYGKSNYKNKYVYFQFISTPIPVYAPHKSWQLS